MNKLLFAASAATLLAVSGAANAAPSATSVDVQVNANVPEVCAITSSSGSIALGDLSPSGLTTPVTYNIAGSCNTKFKIKVQSQYGALRHVPTVLTAAASPNNSLVYNIASTGAVVLSGTSADIAGTGYETNEITPVSPLSGSAALGVTYSGTGVAVLFAGAYTDKITVTLTPVSF